MVPVLPIVNSVTPENIQQLGLCENLFTAAATTTQCLQNPDETKRFDEQEKNLTYKLSNMESEIGFITDRFLILAPVC